MAKNEILLGGVQIGFRNFAGKASDYNDEGSRNFVVFLDEQKAKELEAQGLNVKWPKPLPEDSTLDPDEDMRQPYLPVAITFHPYPAKVVIIVDDKAEELDEGSVDMLDWAQIVNVDLVVRPYHWERKGRSGIKAYTKAIYVTIAQDEFEKKYGI